MKRRGILVLVLCVAVAVAIVGLFGCEKKQNEEKKVMLFLGDSIGEAVAGPSPLTEREGYGYYGIIGRINGYEFYNRAVSGYQTKHLYSYIQREDDGVNMVKSLVSTADIIHISILGNDLLGYDITNMIIEAGDNVFTEEDKRLEIAAENLEKIVEYIKDANPKAKLILQTLYNPVGPDSPLVSNRARTTLAEKSYAAKDYHKLAGKIIERLNDVIYAYYDKHVKKMFGSVTSEPFEIVDVYSKFEDIYNKNFTRWQGLFCPDGIHPTNEGHALIAGEIQALLEKAELAGSDALAKYKQIRYEQLDRLFKDIINVGAAKSNVEKAGDMADVTFAYFNDIKNYSPYYTNKLTYEGRHFDEDIVFDITTLEVGGNNLIGFSLGGISIKLLTEDSGITFKADGTYEMKLNFSPMVLETLRLYIKMTGSLDVSSVIGLDLVYLQKAYLQNMIPGIDYQDIEKSFGIIEKAYGVSVTGIDFEKESVRRMATVLAETGKIILDDPDVLEDAVSLSWSGQYRLQDVKSKLTGETYTAIYINGGIDVGETYTRYTYYPDDEYPDTVRLTVDVANVVICGTERLQ